MPIFSDQGIQPSEKGAPNGVAPLDSSALIPSAYIPSVAINDTYVVASQAAMLASGATQGDLAVRTDTSQNFILTANPGTVLGNWVELAAPSMATVTNGGAGNAGKHLVLDAAGKAAGRVLETDGASLDAVVAAPVLTTTATSAFSAESNLGALTTGLLKITVGAGTATPSTAVAGTDYPQAEVASIDVTSTPYVIAASTTGAPRYFEFDTGAAAITLDTGFADGQLQHLKNVTSSTLTGTGTLDGVSGFTIPPKSSYMLRWRSGGKGWRII